MNTTKCISFERSTVNQTEIRRVRECHDFNDQVIAIDDKLFPNPERLYVNNYVQTGTTSHGTVVNIQDYSGNVKYDPVETQKIVEDAQKQVEDTIDYWDQWQTNFNKQLAKDLGLN